MGFNVETSMLKLSTHREQSTRTPDVLPVQATFFSFQLFEIRLSSLGTLIFVLCVLSSSLSAGTDYDDINYSKGTFFGGASNDSYLLHVALDKNGNVYGTGLGSDIPTTAGVFQPTRHSIYDVIVFKLDSTLTKLIWATYLGGSGNDAAGSIAVDDNGNVYVSGYTNSNDFPVTVSSDASNINSGPAVFAAKISPDGTQLEYCRVFGKTTPITQQTENASKGAQLCIDPAGNAYVLSHTSATNYYVTANAIQPAKNSGIDMVITKLDPGGTIVYSSYVGGSGNDLAGEIVFAQGSLYCTGSTSSADLPGAGGRSPNSQDAFIMRFDAMSQLSPNAVLFIGGSGNDVGSALCYDAHAGRMCLTGKSYSTDLTVEQSFYNGLKTGGFVSTCDMALSTRYFTSILSDGVTPTSLIARSTNSSIFISGYASGSIPTTSNAYSSTKKGSLDGAMFCIDSTGKNLRYGTYIGGSNSDYSTAKVLLFERECSLRVIFGITTHSADFPASRDSYQPDKLNGGDDQPALVLFSQLPVDPVLSTLSQPCNAEVQFKVKAPCPPLGIQWNFGDGGEDAGEGPLKHRYTHNGQFLVTVTLIYPEPDTIRLKRYVEVTGVPDSVRATHYSYPCSKDTTTHLYAYNCVRYEWTPGKDLDDSTIANPRLKRPHNGKYYVHGWDAHGCESWDSVQVYLIDFKAKVLKDTLICRGGKAVLQAFGGSGYSWYPAVGLNRTDKSTVTASPLVSTTYHVVVTDGSCPDTAHVTVRVQDPPVIHVRDAPSLCPGAAAELPLEVEGDTSGLIYDWQPAVAISDVHSPRPLVSPSKTTTYTVRVRNALGCVSVDSVKVSIVNSVKAKVGPNVTLCGGDSVRLVASGGSEYEWVPGDDLDNPRAAQPLCRPGLSRSYTVYVRSGACIDSQKVSVKVVPSPTVSIGGPARCCAGDSVYLHVLQPSAAYRYTWSGIDDDSQLGDTLVLVRPSRDTTYYLRARNAGGCEVRDSIRVLVDSTLQVQAWGDTTICVGEHARLFAAANATEIVWEPADGVVEAGGSSYLVTPTRPTTYIVHARRGSCVGSDTVTVGLRTLDSLRLEHGNIPCRGFTTTLRVESPQDSVSYAWEPAAFLEQTSGATVQTKALFDSCVFRCVASSGTCLTIAQIGVSVHRPPQLRVNADTTLCANGQAQVRLEASELKAVRWTPEEGLSDPQSATPIATCTGTRVYTAVVSDSNGCVDSLQWKISMYTGRHIRLSTGDTLLNAGNYAILRVNASADSSCVTDLHFDVGLDADVLSPQNRLADYTRDGRAYWRFHVPSVRLDAKPIELCRIVGLVCVASKSKSIVSIDSAEVDWTLCADVTSSPGLLSVDGCANTMRKVVFYDGLTASVFPVPALSELMIQTSSSSAQTVQISILSTLGVVVASHRLQLTEGDAIHRVDLRALAAGSYVMRAIRDGLSSDFPFVKY